MNKIKYILTASAFAVVVAGCSGGSSSSVAITGSNVAGVSSAAASAATTATTYSDMAKSFNIYSTDSGISKSGGGDKQVELYNIVKHLKEIKAITDLDRAKGDYTPQSVNTCPGGGTYTVTSTDNTTDPTVSIDYKFSVSYSSCAIYSGGSAMSGDLSGSVSGTTASETISITYSNFTVANSVSSVSINGGMTATITTDPSTSLTTTSLSIPSFVVSGTVNGSQVSASITNYSLTLADTGTDYTIDVSGTVDDSTVGGAVTIATLQTIHQGYSDSFPSSGEMKVSSGSSSVDITFTGSGTYTAMVSGVGYSCSFYTQTCN